MRIQFLGAAETTSGACYLIQSGENRLLVDCGMFHGPEELKQRNYGDFPFNPAEIDAVVLTHAHIDHSGLLPKLVKHGFTGPIYATTVTCDLCSIMLADSGYIQESEVERKNRKRSRRGQELLTPIYTVDDAYEAMKQFRRMVYDEEVPILPSLRVRFRDSGHILGAAIVELWVTEGDQTTKLVFSGDLGNLDQPIVQDPTFITEADLLIIESTYGTRAHENREDRLERLAEVVNSTVKRGGNLLIPAFALGRTQDLLYSLRVLQDEGKIPVQNIYIDSPLATKATEVFQRHARIFDYETRAMLEDGRSPFEAPHVHYTETVQESMRLNSVSGGLVIISASGMADAGRIKHHLKHNLWRPQATVLLVGYQAEGTLGRRLQDGAKEVRIHGETVKVAAQIETITGFSAHADQGALLNWLRRFRYIGKVFVTHGEKESCHGFAEVIRHELKVPVVVPKLDESFDFEGANVVSTWDSRYRGLNVSEKFAGVVQAAKGAEVEFRGAFGLAQRRYKLENRFFTLFNLGSARHFFAQLALARLLEQGRLAKQVLGPWSGEPVWEEKLAELVPGRRPWDVVAEEVLRPAGLSQTAYYYLDQLPAAAAAGYTTTNGGELVENIYAILREGLKPQLFSTAHDLRRLWHALAEGGIISPETARALLEPYRVQGKPDFYQIEGTAPGAQVFLAGSLEEARSVIVLSNGEEGVRAVFEQLITLSGAGR
ncbi:MAG: MBL fold metallo-hydrolase [Bacillota bacterium]|nr:MBL fold metallo-hydrolase [Bacillota bacterium]NLJ03285.1 MBL fold metallo-hydrolase [Bacillota bacterium]